MFSQGNNESLLKRNILIIHRKLGYLQIWHIRDVLKYGVCCKGRGYNNEARGAMIVWIPFV